MRQTFFYTCGLFSTPSLCRNVKFLFTYYIFEWIEVENWIIGVGLSAYFNSHNPLPRKHNFVGFILLMSFLILCSVFHHYSHRGLHFYTSLPNIIIYFFSPAGAYGVVLKCRHKVIFFPSYLYDFRLKISQDLSSQSGRLWLLQTLSVYLCVFLSDSDSDTYLFLFIKWKTIPLLQLISQLLWVGFWWNLVEVLKLRSDWLY